MSRSRRTFLAAGATGALALTAGCLDFARGDSPLELSAEQAVPSDETLAETDYESHQVEEEVVEETVEAGVEREVQATLWTSIYSKAVEYPQGSGQEHEAAFFGAVSIPDYSVLGYSLNPAADMSNEEILEEFLDEMDGDQGEIENVTHQESFDLEILGEGREVDVFDGETELEGREVDVEIKLASFTHEDDVIVLLGTYPAALAEESANVELLMESVEHPV